MTGLVILIVIVARFAWVYPATYVPRFLSKRLRERDPYPSWRTVFVIAFTGVRGAVSLAAALALPYALANGDAFPYRDLILFVTFSLILVTLFGTGLGLPPLVRWLGVARDGAASITPSTRRSSRRGAMRWRPRCNRWRR